MNRKKGFTLVELLAVIVILAVLVLLAVPSVLKMMDNARKNTFELEAEQIVEASKLAYSNDVYETGTEKNCYSLEDLKEYIDKSFGSAYKGSVKITIAEGEAVDNKIWYTAVDYKIWYTNGKHYITGSSSGNLSSSTTKTDGIDYDNCGAATTP